MYKFSPLTEREVYHEPELKPPMEIAKNG